MTFINNKFLEKIYYLITKKRQKKINLKEVKNILSKLGNKKKELTKEQKKKIDDFYMKNYGKKVPYYYHQYAYSVTNIFDETIFPDCLFIGNLEYKLNNKTIAYALADKSMLENILSGINDIKTPKIIARKTNEFNLMYEGYLIDEETFYDKIKNIGECFIKPAHDSNSGKECRKINIIDGIEINTKLKINDFLKTYNNNFVIQELITNSQTLQNINPNSVNTIRIITYINNNKIYVCAPLLRMAINRTSYVDNIHSGGAFIGIDIKTGKLLEKAITLDGEEYYYHPVTNIKFADVWIPNFQKIVEKCKEIHEKRLSMLKMVSFDITLDQNENIVLVELNLIYQSIWLSQYTSGHGIFGKNTIDMLKLLKK